MTNQITQKCQECYEDGLSVSAVRITVGQRGMLNVSLSINTYVPLGEGGDMPHHTLRIDRANVPDGVQCGGWDRHEDVTLQLSGNEEQAEALIQVVAEDGNANDTARFDNDGLVSYLTKPNKWFRHPAKGRE